MDERMDGIQRDLTEFKYSQDRANSSIIAKFEEMGKRFDKYALETQAVIGANAVMADKTYATKADMIRNSSLTGLISAAFAALVTFILANHK